jgi:hypothetical protein
MIHLPAILYDSLSAEETKTKKINALSQISLAKKRM